MGKAKFIYFEDEIEEKLRNEPNKSKLINNLLRDHYRKTELEDLSLDELKQLRKKEIIMQEAQNKIKEIENGGFKEN